MRVYIVRIMFRVYNKGLCLGFRVSVYSRGLRLGFRVYDEGLG